MKCDSPESAGPLCDPSYCLRGVLVLELHAGRYLTALLPPIQYPIPLKQSLLLSTMSPKFTLYRANLACSLAPHILLHELQIPFTTVLMTFTPNGVASADGSLSASDYRNTNHAGLVPALHVSDGSGDAGAIITENPAILTYIASLKPERELFGKNALERAKVYSWLCWLSGTLHGYGYGMILRPGRFTDDEAARVGVVQKGRKTVEESYERIEECLEGKGEYLVGEGFTVADVNLRVLVAEHLMVRKFADADALEQVHLLDLGQAL